MMEVGESPLEVLSRAATMVQVQENRQLSHAGERDESPPPLLPPPAAVQSPPSTRSTSKWKRSRLRLPEYTKSSAKINHRRHHKQQKSPSSESSSSTSSLSSLSPSSSDNDAPDSPEPVTPLDMSVRQPKNGLSLPPPPSYAQTVNNPGFKSRYKPVPKTVTRDEIPSGFSMCDPIIDEHFRRSLGSDYSAIFAPQTAPAKMVTTKTPTTTVNNNNTAVKKKREENRKKAPLQPPSLLTTPQPKPAAPPPPPITNVCELMDTAGLSVDDHFAKALGDTWLKLNSTQNKEHTNVTF